MEGLEILGEPGRVAREGRETDVGAGAVAFPALHLENPEVVGVGQDVGEDRPGAEVLDASRRPQILVHRRGIAHVGPDLGDDPRDVAPRPDRDVVEVIRLHARRRAIGAEIEEDRDLVVGRCRIEYRRAHNFIRKVERQGLPGINRSRHRLGLHRDRIIRGILDLETHRDARIGRVHPHRHLRVPGSQRDHRHRLPGQRRHRGAGPKLGRARLHRLHNLVRTAGWVIGNRRSIAAEVKQLVVHLWVIEGDRRELRRRRNRARGARLLDFVVIERPVVRIIRRVRGHAEIKEDRDTGDRRAGVLAGEVEAQLLPGAATVMVVGPLRGRSTLYLEQHRHRAARPNLHPEDVTLAPVHAFRQRQRAATEVGLGSPGHLHGLAGGVNATLVRVGDHGRHATTEVIEAVTARITLEAHRRRRIDWHLTAEPDIRQQVGERFGGRRSDRLEKQRVRCGDALEGRERHRHLVPAVPQGRRVSRRRDVDVDIGRVRFVQELEADDIAAQALHFKVERQEGCREAGIEAQVRQLRIPDGVAEPGRHGPRWPEVDVAPEIVLQVSPGAERRDLRVVHAEHEVGRPVAIEERHVGDDAGIGGHAGAGTAETDVGQQHAELCLGSIIALEHDTRAELGVAESRNRDRDLVPAVAEVSREITPGEIQPQGIHAVEELHEDDEVRHPLDLEIDRLVIREESGREADETDLCHVGAIPGAAENGQDRAEGLVVGVERVDHRTRAERREFLVVIRDDQVRVGAGQCDVRDDGRTGTRGAAFDLRDIVVVEGPVIRIGVRLAERAVVKDDRQGDDGSRHILAGEIETQFLPGAAARMVLLLGQAARGVALLLQLERHRHRPRRPDLDLVGLTLREVDGLTEIKQRSTEHLIGEFLHPGDPVAGVDAALVRVVDDDGGAAVEVHNTGLRAIRFEVDRIAGLGGRDQRSGNRIGPATLAASRQDQGRKDHRRYAERAQGGLCVHMRTLWNESGLNSILVVN